MAGTLHVAWGDKLTRYDFGPGHPLAPVRVELTIELARDLGVLDADNVTVTAPEPATDAELELVHYPRYVAAVKQASGPDPGSVVGRFGLGTEDNPIFPGMHAASALVAGATLAAARAVWSGAATHGASIGGGLHHAMPDHASGFCVYNDPAIAIRWLLNAGAERVAYVDIDVHHGDGVQAAFYNDPRVLTISLHEHPATLFPGTGRPSEAGGPDAAGYSVNVALPAGTRDAGWLRAFHAVVPPLLREFQPQVLVSQHGCDTHWMDPLANLELTIDAQRAAHAALHGLAHEVAGGRWVLTGGGGYELVKVVPRTWTHLLAEAAGRPLDPQTPTPASWRQFVKVRTGAVAPESMTEGAPAQFPDFEAGFDPDEPVDQAIMATRSAIFPAHGLLPLATMIFADRADAGRRLAAVLEASVVPALAGAEVVVLGLPRGGVPVAAQIAAALHAPLDVIVVRKLGVPYRPELGMGAIGEGGTEVLNAAVLADADVSRSDLEAVRRREQAELIRRARKYRGDRPPVPLSGKIAIVVDDGVATGSTARAACRIAREHGAARVVLAVPVAPPGFRERLGDDADDFACVVQPEPFFSIGQFYQDFSATSDTEVIACLRT